MSVFRNLKTVLRKCNLWSPFYGFKTISLYCSNGSTIEQCKEIVITTCQNVIRHYQGV